jgi:hypothetical protein
LELEVCAETGWGREQVRTTGFFLFLEGSFSLGWYYQPRLKRWVPALGCHPLVPVRLVIQTETKVPPLSLIISLGWT